MKDLRGTYVHRGDVERRKRRVRGAIMLMGIVAVAAFAVRDTRPAAAEARGLGSADRAEVARLEGEVESARNELQLASAHLERWNRIFHYSKRYAIPSELSASIYDAAVNERIDPDLAFPLIRLESRFDERATSPVGAIGLMQVMLPTARGFEPSISADGLYDRSVNLRIGFRYLRQLIKWQRGDVQMALLAYNRGPSAVTIAKELDLDPSNGYDRVVLKGYRGRGVLD